MNKKKVGTLFGRPIVTGEIGSLKKNELFCNISDDKLYSLTQFNEMGLLVSSSTTSGVAKEYFCYVPTTKLKLINTLLESIPEFLAGSTPLESYCNICAYVLGKNHPLAKSFSFGGTVQANMLTMYILLILNILDPQYNANIFNNSLNKNNTPFVGKNILENLEECLKYGFIHNVEDCFTNDFNLIAKCEALDMPIITSSMQNTDNLNGFFEPFIISSEFKDENGNVIVSKYKLILIDLYNKSTNIPTFIENSFYNAEKLLYERLYEELENEGLSKDEIEFMINSAGGEIGAMIYTVKIFSRCTLYFSDIFTIMTIPQYLAYSKLPEKPIEIPEDPSETPNTPPDFGELTNPGEWFPYDTPTIPNIINDDSDEVINYGITVGDVNVTNKNRAGITGRSIEGTIIFDPNTYTLYLKDANIFMIDCKNLSSNKNLNIVVIGNCIVSCCIYACYRKTIITGPGALYVGYIECRIGPNSSVDCHLLIQNAKVLVNRNNQYYNWGLYGYGNEILELEHSIVEIAGLEVACGDFKEIILNDCTHIIPDGVTATNGYFRQGSQPYACYGDEAALKISYK